jgi:hypothetical protein
MVTLCPTGRTQPVAASGCLASGAAAAQIVWVVLLTNVTSRAPIAADEAAEVAPAVGWDRVGVADARRAGAEERAVAGLVAVAGWLGDAGLAVAGLAVLAGTPTTGVAAGDAAGPTGWAAHAVVTIVISAATTARASRLPASPPRSDARPTRPFPSSAPSGWP